MKLRIILFDDIAKNREEVLIAVRSALDKKGEVVAFTAGAGGQKPQTHEGQLEKDLLMPPNAPATLLLADRDLSSYEAGYRGLSESTVRRVADLVGIPECGYARGDRDDDTDYVKRGDQSESCIRLSLKPSIDQFAKRVVAIAEGFMMISEKLKSSKDFGRQSPGKLLAAIIDKPEYAEKISLYSSGDQSRLGTIHRMRGIPDDQKMQRLACLLGYWLWDSVLRFPGVTVGLIPASSYLNIREDVFSGQDDVQNLFSSALYNGTFAAAKVRMWWRGMLDDIIADRGCMDGREFASKKLSRDIPPSQCCEENTIPAGYYCMLKEKPVSLRNSKGGLAWFPRGADLARVSVSALEELGPWL